MGKWWDDETPEVLETEKNVVRYYPQAQRLQVARPNWTNDDGESKPGKAVVFDLSEPGAMEFLRRIAKTE